MRACALGLALSCALFGIAIGDDSLPPDVVQKLKSSSVYVKTQIGPIELTGSGFAFRSMPDAVYVVTNQHVVAKPKVLEPGSYIPGLRGRDKIALRRMQSALAGSEVAVTVVFNSGAAGEKAYKAEIAAQQSDPDLAILKVSGVQPAPPLLALGASTGLIETMPVFIVGFPFGEALATNHGNPAITVGKGSVSSLRNDDKGKIAKIQIDGAINPGNSGGPVVDTKGNVVGIAVQTIQGSNIGLAIPPTAVEELLAGRIGRVSLGTKVQDGKPVVEMTVPVMDPMQRLKSAMVYYVKGALPIDPTKAGTMQVATAAGSQKIDVPVNQANNTSPLALKVDGGETNLEVTVQVSFIDQQGQTVHLDPQVLKVSVPQVTTTTTRGKDGSVSITQTQKNGKSSRQVTITTSPAKKGGGGGGFGLSDDADDDSDGDSKSSKSKSSKKGSIEGKDEKDGAGSGGEAAWTNRISKMKKIPDEEVTGKVGGVEFTLDKASLQSGHLELRKGNGFWADIEIDVVLFTFNEDVSGRKFVVNGRSRAGDPSASFSVKRKGAKLPEPYLTHEVLLVLEFGDYDAESRVQPGKIYICFPDRSKSFVAGTFEAECSY